MLKNLPEVEGFLLLIVLNVQVCDATVAEERSAAGSIK